MKGREGSRKEGGGVYTHAKYHSSFNHEWSRGFYLGFKLYWALGKVGPIEE